MTVSASRRPIERALISVFKKDGLEPLVAALKARGVEILSTGGTADFLEKLGHSVTRVERVTEFPEMMDGRVKTLHPRVFGGILARREAPEDVAACREHRIPLVDLVVVNLYPFRDHRDDALERQVTFVDIGGPSMLRAAAKNFRSVAVLSDPADYAEFLDVFAAGNGTTTEAYRLACAVRTFERTARYDVAIADRWRRFLESASVAPAALSLEPKLPLRYGENPHQTAFWASDQEPTWNVLQGKELSYNNLLDAEAVTKLVSEFAEPTCAIVKHNSPCGVATGGLAPVALFERAFAADSLSAFGGVVAFNRPVDGPAAEALAKPFLEVVVAPAFDDEALRVLSAKKNLRLVAWPTPRFSPFDIRPAMGGWLVQSADPSGSGERWRTVTKRSVPAALEADLRFAWLVAKHARSNAIVVAKDGVTLGIGAGHVSRVDAVETALRKAPATALAGAVVASEAFFPFRDSIDRLAAKGIAAVVQPGGSVKDAEVIAACDENGMAMAFTGRRHFRH